MRTFLFILALVSAPLVSWGDATSLFSELKGSVFQIRVIDIGSGDKFSIGSGFQISAEGHIATNFHVVSSYVHEPEKYRLEFVRSHHTHRDETTETVHPTELLTFDVIHDLAILSMPKVANLPTKVLALSPQALSKGDRIYSMGNPHDLGMTIIEGNYNGLLQNSRYKKILFSGSLNPGMSGGPAINEKGEVLGINVSTQGDEISYLVPVIYLQQLQNSLTDNPAYSANDHLPNYNPLIQQSLFNDQQDFYSDILAAPFNTQNLGQVTVAHDLSDSLKCWGHTTNSEEDNYTDKAQFQGTHQHCVTEDQIYINNDISSGQFYYDFEWITTQTLNPFQFYHVIQERFEHNHLGNAYQEKYITEFTCVDDIIQLADHAWKISSCLRTYKDYPRLFDAQLVMASLDENQQALVAKIGAAGISRDNALLMFQRFMESISWNK